jgi:hypothetical protein
MLEKHSKHWTTRWLAIYIGGTNIGLNPTGNNVECILLNALSSMGTVSAMVDHKFVNATVEPLPAILGKDWSEVGLEMKRLIDDETNGGKQLDLKQALKVK